MSAVAMNNKAIQALSSSAAKAAPRAESLEKTFATKATNDLLKAPQSIKNRDINASKTLLSVSIGCHGVFLDSFRKAASEWKPKISDQMFSALIS